MALAIVGVLANAGCGSGSGGGSPGTGGTGGIGGAGGGGGCAGRDPCPGQCNAQGWCNLQESAQLFVDVWGSSPNDVWVLPQDPSIRHFDGQSWTTMSLPTTYDVDRVWGRAPDDVWVGGGSGQVAHYDGSTWTLDPLPDTERVQAFWSDGPGSSVMALGSSGTLYERDAAGWTAKAKWSATQTQGRSVNLLGCDGVHYATGSQVYSDFEGRWMGYGLGRSGSDVSNVSATLALGGNQTWVLVGKLMRFDGSAWRWDVSELSLGNLISVAGTSEQDAWALTEDQRLMRSTGAGFTEALSGSAVKTAKWLYASAPGVVDIVDELGAISRYDGSTTTTVVADKPSGAPLGVGWSPTGEAIALTYDGLYAVDTTTSSWKQLGSTSTSTSGNPQASISATSSDDVWCAVSSKLLHWNGAQLSTVNLPGPGSTTYKAVAAISPKDVWVAAPDATLHFDGTNWSVVDSDPTVGSAGSQGAAALVANASDDVWVIRGSDRFAHFDGSKFTEFRGQEQLGHLGCGASKGELIGIGVQPAPIYAGAVGNMQLVTDTYVDGYGADDAWLGGLDDIWVVGYDPAGPGKQVLHYDGAFSTSLDATGYGLIALWAFPGGEVYAVGYDAILHRKPQ